MRIGIYKFIIFDICAPWAPGSVAGVINLDCIKVVITTIMVIIGIAKPKIVKVSGLSTSGRPRSIHKKVLFKGMSNEAGMKEYKSRLRFNNWRGADAIAKEMD